MKAHPELPDFARRFLRTGAKRRTRLLVYSLHRWLDRRRLAIADLTPELFRTYLSRPWKIRVLKKIQFQYGNLLRSYMRWLYERGLVSFVPDSRLRRPLELPNLAREFLSSLEPTHRLATRLRYAYSLRKLYGWLNAHGHRPERITRAETSLWFQSLHTSGLRAVSRSHILVDVRRYLHWLSERRHMRTAPDELIRSKDVPKLPQYLPRPLTATADRELQRRLRDAMTPGARGLLLMRRTGLRIGELRNLEYHCVRDDLRRPMLKVPLGKLNNERLVPLDAESIELIRALQSLAPRPRAWLVPGARGMRMSYDQLRRLLTMHSRDLPDPLRVTSHRLRHTYATEMLSAGMSLPGLMRLLGHRDLKMTMRYAAMTPEIVADEYTKALTQLSSKYRLPAPSERAASEPDPDELLDRLAGWLRKNSARSPKALLQRVERIRHEARKLNPTTKHKQ